MSFIKSRKVRAWIGVIVGTETFILTMMYMDPGFVAVNLFIGSVALVATSCAWLLWD